MSGTAFVTPTLTEARNHKAQRPDRLTQASAGMTK